MPQFLFIYHGGSMPETEEEGQKALAAWEKWFTSMGDKVVDAGHAIGQSTTVNCDGRVTNDGGVNPASGYGVFEAGDLNEAIAMAKGCPLLADGGSVELGETFDP